MKFFCFSIPLVVHFNWLGFLLFLFWVVSVLSCPPNVFLRGACQRDRIEALNQRNGNISQLSRSSRSRFPKIKVCDSMQSCDFPRRIVLVQAYRNKKVSGWPRFKPSTLSNEWFLWCKCTSRIRIILDIANWIKNLLFEYNNVILHTILFYSC